MIPDSEPLNDTVVELPGHIVPPPETLNKVSVLILKVAELEIAVRLHCPITMHLKEVPFIPNEAAKEYEAPVAPEMFDQDPET